MTILSPKCLIFEGAYGDNHFFENFRVPWTVFGNLRKSSDIQSCRLRKSPHSRDKISRLCVRKSWQVYILHIDLFGLIVISLCVFYLVGRLIIIEALPIRIRIFTKYTRRLTLYARKIAKSLPGWYINIVVPLSHYYIYRL